MEKLIDKKVKLSGVVAETKMTGTVKVLTTTRKAHAKYKKILEHKKYYLAHTDMELNSGDKVVIMACKPYSKNVKWVVIRNDTK